MSSLALRETPAVVCGHGDVAISEDARAVILEIVKFLATVALIATTGLLLLLAG